MAPEKRGASKVKARKAAPKKQVHPGLPSRKTLDLVDVFLFLCDARIPGTSVKLAGPFLTKSKRIYILAKPDLADPAITREWIAHFEERGVPAFAVDCSTGDGLDPLISHLRRRRDALMEKMPDGVSDRPIRIMLFGPPNVGKSSLANRLLGTQKAPFGAKPGLTRGSHWLRGRGFLEVLDTPGVVQTSEVKGEAKMKLASVWALPERAYDAVDLAFWIVGRIFLADGGEDDRETLRYLEEFGRQRGFLRQGGIVDLDRACKIFIHEFREGRLGRFTLEEPFLSMSKDIVRTLAKGDAEEADEP